MIIHNRNSIEQYLVQTGVSEGKVILNDPIFFKESKITRGYNVTLVKEQRRLDVGKYSFSQRTINVWNKICTDCVHASSVNNMLFNNRIDKFLVKAGYI